MHLQNTTILKEFLNAGAHDRFRDLARQLWLSPLDMDTQIRRVLTVLYGSDRLRSVTVSGETQGITLYAHVDDAVLVYTPFAEARRTPVLSEIVGDFLAEHDIHLALLRATEALGSRLALPIVILVNPCVAEVFPAPRLPLCVSSLAAYLRRLHKADVRILDMQFTNDEEDIVRTAIQLDPAIVGVSISFGQTDAAIRLLEHLSSAEKRPMLVVGNVVAAFAVERLLSRFPHLVVATGEGEESLSALVEVAQRKRHLADVPGVAYLDADQLHRTPKSDLDMATIPLPALDGVGELHRAGGALTLELSRGCFHSACTFCPRTHKPRRWKGIPATEALEQLACYARLFDYLGGERRIFMADEEFIGWGDGDAPTARVEEISRGMQARDMRLRFETNTRIDQVFNPRMTRAWHERRLAMLASCRDAGLDRLLVGVESGSDSTLQRFNKNITSRDSIMALRLLSALDIGVRITFITFDPLMTFDELKANVAFLSRRDAYLRSLVGTDLTFGQIYDGVQNDTFVDEYRHDAPVYEYVSYMLVSLEVLRDSAYALHFPEARDGAGFDMTMARHHVAYRHPAIGLLAEACQKWIDKHFALDYYLKGLYKTLDAENRAVVFGLRKEYRRMSFELLTFLMQQLSPLFENPAQPASDLQSAEAILLGALDQFNTRMVQFVDDLEALRNSKEIPDPIGGLDEVVARWRASSGWSLLNP